MNGRSIKCAVTTYHASAVRCLDVVLLLAIEALRGVKAYYTCSSHHIHSPNAVHQFHFHALPIILVVHKSSKHIRSQALTPPNSMKHSAIFQIQSVWWSPGISQSINEMQPPYDAPMRRRTVEPLRCLNLAESGYEYLANCMPSKS